MKLVRTVMKIRNQSADNGNDADDRMEEKTDCDIDRHPRQVEKGGRASPRQEGPDLVEIPHDRKTIIGPTCLDGRFHHDLENTLAQDLINTPATGSTCDCGSARTRPGKCKAHRENPSAINDGMLWLGMTRSYTCSMKNELVN